ncbi:hypothetical protein HPP92_007924 [Vanilla planifolia]|uniref:Uncharacterized protein n=1 Tax=Vanilla planifolia TaxID=51239 RepID=A0A835V969_VANPL|nr:hypothetical protein HPP92_007924 [Vanilla planifolia]
MDNYQCITFATNKTYQICPNLLVHYFGFKAKAKKKDYNKTPLMYKLLESLAPIKTSKNSVFSFRKAICNEKESHDHRSFDERIDSLPRYLTTKRQWFSQALTVAHDSMAEDLSDLEAVRPSSDINQFEVSVDEGKKKEKIVEAHNSLGWSRFTRAKQRSSQLNLKLVVIEKVERKRWLRSKNRSISFL